MRAHARYWCSDLDRRTIQEPHLFHRLIAAGTCGFSVGSESDARAALCVLDESRPYGDYLVACDAPLRKHILHPNIALGFVQNGGGLEAFQDAISHGMNVVLRIADVFQAANAFIDALAERHRCGQPLFAIRAVFAFDGLSEHEATVFRHLFQSSHSFHGMLARGARMPRLLCATASAQGAIILARSRSAMLCQNDDSKALAIN